MTTHNIPLGEVCQINPAINLILPEAEACSFVPMEAVDDVAGVITQATLRPYRDVQRGYTAFAERDVLIAKITPCMENGKCAVANRLRNGIGFGSTEFHVLRASDRVLPEWLYYFWRLPETRKRAERSMTGSAGQKRVPARFLEALAIPIPPMSKQRRVVKKLEQSDRLRRIHRYALELSDSFLAACFRSLFADPIVNSNGYPRESLESLVQPDRPITYGILKPGHHVVSGVPYVRVTDIQDGRVLPANVRRTTPEIDTAYRRSRLKVGDLLLTIRGHVGRLGIVPAPLNGANITQDTARLAPIGSVNVEYLMGCLAAEGMQKFMAKHVRGAAVQGINLGDVKELPIPVPPSELQQRYTQIVSVYDRLRASQRESQRQADHLFQSLLHQAFVA